MIDVLAYVDPASTALVWQILAGVLITLGVVLGIWWTKITTAIKSVWVKIFGDKKKKPSVDASKNADDELADEESIKAESSESENEE